MIQFETETERLARADHDIAMAMAMARAAQESLRREREKWGSAIDLLRYCAQLRNPGYKVRVRSWLRQHFGEDFYMKEVDEQRLIDQQEMEQIVQAALEASP